MILSICGVWIVRQTITQWSVEDLFNSYYQFTNNRTATALDNLGLFEDHSVISHTDPEALFSQQWQLVSAGSGYYKIMNRKGGKVLEDKGGNGVSVVLAEEDETENAPQFTIQYVIVSQPVRDIFPDRRRVWGQ